MSTATQIAGTLHHFFPTSSDERNTVYLLKVPLTNKITEQNNVVRWESPDASICGPREGEGMFPHLYFQDDTKPGEYRLFLKSNEVDSVKELVSEPAMVGWDDALSRLGGWLF